MAFQAMNHGLEARATSGSRHDEPPIAGYGGVRGVYIPRPCGPPPSKGELIRLPLGELWPTQCGGFGLGNSPFEGGSRGMLFPGAAAYPAIGGTEGYPQIEG